MVWCLYAYFPSNHSRHFSYTLGSFDLFMMHSESVTASFQLVTDCRVNRIILPAST
jgi:hypothetical protein